jgi:hypothetical protein
MEKDEPMLHEAGEMGFRHGQSQAIGGCPKVWLS